MADGKKTIGIDLILRVQKFMDGFKDAETGALKGADGISKGLKKIDDTVDQVSKKAGGIGQSLLAGFAGGAIFGGLSNLISGSFAEMEQGAAESRQLGAALQSLGGDTQKVKADLEEFSDAREAITNFGGETKELMAFGVTFAKITDPEKLKQFTVAVQDYAAATGKDLQTASASLAQKLEAGGKDKALNIKFEPGDTQANLDKFLDAAGKQISGFAEKTADPMIIMRNQLAGTQEALGSLLASAITPLLPALQLAAKWFAAIATFLTENKTVSITLAIAVGALTFAVNAAAIAFKLKTFWTTAITKAQWLWNAAMTANPIGLIVAAVALLVGGLIYLYENVEGVREAFDDFYQFLKGAVIGAFEGLKNAVMSVVSVYIGFYKIIWDGIKIVAGFVAEFLGVKEVLDDVIGTIEGAGKAVLSFLGLTDDASDSVDGLTESQKKEKIAIDAAKEAQRLNAIETEKLAKEKEKLAKEIAGVIDAHNKEKQANEQAKGQGQSMMEVALNQRRKLQEYLERGDLPAALRAEAEENLRINEQALKNWTTFTKDKVAVDKLHAANQKLVKEMSGDVEAEKKKVKTFSELYKDKIDNERQSYELGEQSLVKTAANIKALLSTVDADAKRMKASAADLKAMKAEITKSFTDEEKKLEDLREKAMQQEQTDLDRELQGINEHHAEVLVAIDEAVKAEAITKDQASQYLAIAEARKNSDILKATKDFEKAKLEEKQKAIDEQMNLEIERINRERELRDLKAQNDESLSKSNEELALLQSQLDAELAIEKARLNAGAISKELYEQRITKLTQDHADKRNAIVLEETKQNNLAYQASTAIIGKSIAMLTDRLKQALAIRQKNEEKATEASDKLKEFQYKKDLDDLAQSVRDNKISHEEYLLQKAAKEEEYSNFKKEQGEADLAWEEELLNSMSAMLVDMGGKMVDTFIQNEIAKIIAGQATATAGLIASIMTTLPFPANVLAIGAGVAGIVALFSGLLGSAKGAQKKAKGGRIYGNSPNDEADDVAVDATSDEHMIARPEVRAMGGGNIELGHKRWEKIRADALAGKFGQGFAKSYSNFMATKGGSALGVNPVLMRGASGGISGMDLQGLRETQQMLAVELRAFREKGVHVYGSSEIKNEHIRVAYKQADKAVIHRAYSSDQP